jgi:DNA-binding NarL/FixJ family response regulator
MEKRSGPEIQCIVADDNEEMLDALGVLLSGEPGHGVIGQARTGIETLQRLQALPTTAVVLDLRLPDMDGIEVARRAAEILRRKTVIVMHTSWADPAQVRAALDAGARAVVLKDAQPENLLVALRDSAAGRIYVDPKLGRR